MRRAITVDEARRIAEKKKLQPGRVKGTTRVQLTYGRNPRIEVIDWALFSNCLKRKGLCIGEDGGFLKIMRRR